MTAASSARTGNRLHTGMAYFIKGTRLLTHPQLRKYILIPLIVNCAIFAFLTGLAISQFDYFSQIDWNLPAWLDFLEKAFKWVLWFLLVVVFIIAYGYTFNIITSILAAPFYGVLAQRAEELISGRPVADEPLFKLIPRTLFREFNKLIYFVTRGLFIVLLMLLLSTIPLLNLLVPIIGLLWGAWSMALQYSDYAADNHQTEFTLLRKKLRHCKYSSIGFGGTVMGCSMIPIVNIFTIPAAVIGGTCFWLEELEELERKSVIAASMNP